MDFTPSLDAKNFFRFTGPPENWLTAIKFMTWGLEEKYRYRWNDIQTGDIFFIHSTGAGSSLFKNAKSGIIGLGVVGSNFSIKENYLWIHEYKDKVNKWPLLVPFSEIYLFSVLPDPNTWQAPDLNNIESTRTLIDSLLQNYIPLSNVVGFPQMGSFSAVSKEPSQQILYDSKPLYVYSSDKIDNILTSKSTKLEPVKNVSETMRYADSLEVFNNIKKRIITREGRATYGRNNELLAKAEEVHSTIIQNLIDIFRSKGYDTRSNKHVDLFAHNKDRSFLFEVKSTENKNFRTQARKGIVQLFEYDYFEVRKFIKENNIDFKEKYRMLIPSQQPSDNNYIDFINDLSIGMALVDNESLKPIGADFGFAKI